MEVSEDDVSVSSDDEEEDEWNDGTLAACTRHFSPSRDFSQRCPAVCPASSASVGALGLMLTPGAVGEVLRMVTGLVITHSDQISPSETLACASQTSPFEVASGGTQFMSL